MNQEERPYQWYFNQLANLQTSIDERKYFWMDAPEDYEHLEREWEGVRVQAQNFLHESQFNRIMTLLENIRKP